MFFLFRMTFWLGVVLILLPSSSTQRGSSTNDVGTGDAISAASATVEDLRGFCTRQPDACTVGSHVATAIGYRAQAGAKMLYEVLSEAIAPHETGSLARGAGNDGDGKSAADKIAAARLRRTRSRPPTSRPSGADRRRGRTASTRPNTVLAGIFGAGRSKAVSPDSSSNDIDLGGAALYIQGELDARRWPTSTTSSTISPSSTTGTTVTAI